MKIINNFILSAITLAFFIGCGGGGSSSNPEDSSPSTGNPSSNPGTEIPSTETPPPTTETPVLLEKEISSFLSRSTFGATTQEIQSLAKEGNYEQWIETQFTKTPSYHLQWAKDNAKGVNTIGDLRDNPQDWEKHSDALNFLQRDAWWDIAVFGEDQLRQRVAFALSEIMVISKFGPLINYPDARMSYYDVLVKNAFSNFETLLQEVTYHPAMGKYLSYLGNSKANLEQGNHPDENYARELMQLFTIGLYELNIDGSKKTDSQGNHIATYIQKDIEQMAKVFTGLTDQNDFFFVSEGGSTHKSKTQTMIAKENYHDKSEKSIMTNTIPAGGNTKDDINLALKNLFNHPNMGPFLAKRLIQRLVTSNPSPKYIKHVSLAFNNNGQGIRGDLKAVIKAILLYKEDNSFDSFGKVKEPLLFVSHLFRAFQAQKSENILHQGSDEIYTYPSFNFNGTGYSMQEGPLEALTVFNYFTPEDAPFSLKKEGLVAPEFKVLASDKLHQLIMGLINKDAFIYETFNITAPLQLEKYESLIEDKKYDDLLDKLDILLLAGNISSITRTAINNYINKYEDLPSDILARHVISLIMTSPDFAIQR
jgi:uncharacterized protein (DUF1800 family)